MTRILLVEDDELLRENFSELLRDEGFEVEACADSATTLKRFDQPLPDLVILDITLGKETDAGFRLCSELRKRSETIPIIFFTSHSSDFDKISGMRFGVDDYLTKDVSLDYLVVRIKTLLRRIETLSGAKAEPENELRRGDLTINMHSLTARWKGTPLKLSLTQLWMLHALASHPGHVKSYEQLMNAAKITVEPNTIAAHIKNIRKIFQDVDSGFSAIRTERNMGYRWLSD
ncbi:MAG TPA: response regulator [Rhodocyclaceae bacterium]|nr:response regulator [Rhodocyclaceae bacterium]